MRTTSTRSRTRVRVVLEVEGERDESDSFRHKWTTRVTLGHLRASGRNSQEAGEALAEALLELAHSDAAADAIARERAAAASLLERESRVLGPDEAMRRVRLRARGQDPDLPIDDFTGRIKMWRIRMAARFSPEVLDDFLRKNREQVEQLLATARHV